MKLAKTRVKTAAAAVVLLCLAAVLLLGGEYVPERLPGLRGAETTSAKAQGTQKGITADTEVARINGRAVTAEELNYAMGLQRTKVIEYFRNTYNQDYDKGFWQLEIGGENPQELIKSEALKAWTRSKILLEMGQEKGLAGSTDFSWLLSEMERENRQRAQAAAAGKPVFGPVQMDESTFIPYYLSKLEVALQEKLAKTADPRKEEQPGSGEPASAAAGQQGLEFTRISIAYRSGEKSEAEAKREAGELLVKVRQLLLHGRSPEDVAGEVLNPRNDSASRFDLALSRERLDRVSSRVYFREQGELYAWLTGAREAGEVSPVMDEGFIGEWVMAVINDAGRAKPGAAEVQMNGITAEDSSVERELEQRARAARVERSEPGYSGLQLH